MQTNQDIEENTHIFNMLDIYQKFPNLLKNSILANFVIYHEWINVIIQIAYNRRMRNKKYEHLPRLCIPIPLSGTNRFGFCIIDEDEPIDKKKLLDDIESTLDNKDWAFYYDKVKHLGNCDLFDFDYNKEIERMAIVIELSQRNIKFP